MSKPVSPAAEKSAAAPTTSHTPMMVHHVGVDVLTSVKRTFLTFHLGTELHRSYSFSAHFDALRRSHRAFMASPRTPLESSGRPLHDFYTNATVCAVVGQIMIFDEVKTDTLNLRVAPSFKTALKAVGDAEHRSMVNMLEVLLANYYSKANQGGHSSTKAHPTRRAAPKHKLTHEPVSSYKNIKAQPDSSETQ